MWTVAAYDQDADVVQVRKFSTKEEAETYKPLKGYIASIRGYRPNGSLWYAQYSQAEGRKERRFFLRDKVEEVLELVNRLATDVCRNNDSEAGNAAHQAVMTLYKVRSLLKLYDGEELDENEKYWLK